VNTTLEARLRKFEASMPESQTIYRFAATVADAERIEAECDARGERVVIIRRPEASEEGRAVQ
jgi:hypothetical protein